jgi:isopentenyl diphosphate isomerase/L-lactate dehydrogenase-like FMN-dependent dehydrogenase
MTAEKRTGLKRREVLLGLAAAPWAAALSGYIDEAHAAEVPADELATSADKVLSLSEFEALAKRRLPPAHFAYLASGADDDKTVRANLNAFDKWFIRPRRMVDVTNVDTSVNLFGVRWPTPISLAPIGSQGMMHPDGELGTARAARAANHLQILSTVATTSVEDVAKVRGDGLWFQVYPTTQWAITEKLVKRADAAGCAAVVITADYPAPPNRETQFRGARVDSRDCTQCHTGATGDLRRRPMYAGTEVTTENFRASNLNWDVVARLRDTTSKRVLIKGILTAEDAVLCVKYGVDGLIVSNHGGRAMETGRGTLDCLSEIVTAAKHRLPVIIDGGFRRGTDIFKAFALGADAISIGRPYCWALAAFGEAGVARALQIIRTEFETTMRLAGVTSIKGITAQAIGRV